VDFLLVLIELFRCVTAESLRAKKRSKIAPTNYSFFSKTRLNDLSYGIKIWTDLSSILSQITRLSDGQTDRQTDRRADRQTEFSSLDRVCITCSAEKCISGIIFYSFQTVVVVQTRMRNKLTVCFEPPYSSGISRVLTYYSIKSSLESRATKISIR